MMLSRCLCRLSSSAAAAAGSGSGGRRQCGGRRTTAATASAATARRRTTTTPTAAATRTATADAVVSLPRGGAAGCGSRRTTAAVRVARRCFSAEQAEPSASAGGDGGGDAPPPQPAPQPAPAPSFKYDKSRALFERVTATLSEDDVRRLAELVNGEAFGRPLRRREFYYSGFGRGGGGRRKGGAGADAAQADAAEEEQGKTEEKTAVDVKLAGFDSKSKIKIIKEVRAIVPGLGLKEAKELVEGAPVVLQKQVKVEEAEAVKARLEELGAEIELA